MLCSTDLVGENAHVPCAAKLRDDAFLASLGHEVVVGVAVSDEIRDGADLEAMLGGERDEVGQAGHCAIVFHDLADHASGLAACEAGDINRRLCVACAYEHAAVAGAQREDVTRRRDRGGGVFLIDRGGDCQGAVRGRNPGADTFAGFD